jgi:hypothetical protein
MRLLRHDPVMRLLALALAAAALGVIVGGLLAQDDEPRRFGRIEAFDPAGTRNAVLRAAVRTACGVRPEEGDFDGDGAADLAIVYVRLPASQECGYGRSCTRHRLAVLTASGRQLDRALPCGNPKYGGGRYGCTYNCMGGGTADLDGDGRDELAVIFHQGACGVSMHYYAISKGSLARVDLPGGQPLELDHYACGCCGVGFHCRAASDGSPLVVSTEESRFDLELSVQSKRVYEISGGRARLREKTTRLLLVGGRERFPPHGSGCDPTRLHSPAAGR